MSIAKRLIYADATTRRRSLPILDVFKTWEGGPKQALPPKKTRQRKAKAPK